MAGMESREGLDCRAFTLVEIMIVVVIIGVLASFAIPAFMKVRESSYVSRLANDFRTYAGAFELYYLENGSWPEDANHGDTPEEMEGYINGFEELFITGDQWDWDRNAVGARAGVSLRGGVTTVAVMEKIDEKVDDGDLSSGRFQQRNNRFTLELDF